MAPVGRDGDTSLNTGIETTQGIPNPYPSQPSLTKLPVADLPLHELCGVNATLKHVVDITHDVEPPNKSAIEAVVAKGKRSLRAVQTEGVLALPVEGFFFTLADVDLDVLDFAVRPIIKIMKTVAAGILGGPGSGKTPLARIIALCASWYWKPELGISSSASFRGASEFDSEIRINLEKKTFFLYYFNAQDFVHGQPGCKDRPDAHDDGRLAAEPIPNMTGFADVGCTMMTKERWGAAKFVQGQMHVIACNDYVCTDALKQCSYRIIARASCLTYHTKTCWLCSLQLCPRTPQDGCFQAHEHPRKNILVNAGKCLLFRCFTQEEIMVPCLSMGASVEFLQPSSGDRHQQNRDTNVSIRPTFHQDVQWQADYVDAILNGKSPPGPPSPSETVMPCTSSLMQIPQPPKHRPRPPPPISSCPVHMFRPPKHRQRQPRRMNRQSTSSRSPCQVRSLI